MSIKMNPIEMKQLSLPYISETAVSDADPRCPCFYSLVFSRDIPRLSKYFLNTELLSLTAMFH